MSVEPFRLPHRVGYAECTVGNHIYYSRYLDLLERARGEMLRHLGAPFLRWQELDTIFPVIECRLRYHAPARYDDQLTVEVWLAELGKVRLQFAHRILNAAGRVLVEGETRHVCTGLNDKPKRLPADLVALLQPYLEVPVPDTDPHGKN